MSRFPPRANDSEQRIAQLFPVVLACYFLLQAGIRIAQQGALELDEAEQVFHSQQLFLGYDSQPPLYVWLQWLTFQLFGVGHAGLAVLKNALLFGLYLSVYQAARLLLGTLAAAAIASSLVLIVPLGWEAQIDRTHSILATTLAAGTLWTYFALLRHPARLRRVLFGLLLGLGMQAKYNFVIFALGLVTASLVVREHRNVLWTRDAWLSVAAAALCMLPHAFWFLQHVEAATGDTLSKMHSGGIYADYASNVANGARHTFLSIASFVSPLWIVLALAYRSPTHAQLRPHGPDTRFFLWLYATGLACIAALVLSGHLAHIKSRWLQPLLFSFPIAVFVLFTPKAESVYRRLMWIACLCAVAMVVALSLRPQLQTVLGRHSRVQQPFAELAAELVRRFPDAKAIAVQDRYIGGNLRLHLQHVPVMLLDTACKQIPFIDGKVVVLANGASQEQLLSYMEACPGVLVAEHGQIGAHSATHPRDDLQFGYRLLERAP